MLFIIECLYYDAHYNNASHIDCDVATCRSQPATIPDFQFNLVFFSAVHYSYVTGFGKTDHIVTIDISRNTDLKYRSHHGSLVLDCSHARFAV